MNLETWLGEGYGENPTTKVLEIEIRVGILQVSGS